MRYAARVATTRQTLIALLAAGPRTASSLARELGLDRRQIDQDLRHAIRTAEAAGHHVIVEPARCKACGFEFDQSRLIKPSKCPACKGSRLLEALLRVD
jgi:predicted Zn-ribbon and HTH transcriptional regulator